MAKVFPRQKLEEMQKACLLTPRKNRLIAVHVARLTPVLADLATFFESVPPTPKVVPMWDLLDESERGCVDAAYGFAKGGIDREELSYHWRTQHGMSDHYHWQYVHGYRADRAENLSLLLRYYASTVAADAAKWQSPSAATRSLVDSWSYVRASWAYHGNFYMGNPRARNGHRSVCDDAKVRVQLLHNGIITDIAEPAAMAGRERSFHPQLVDVAEAAAAAGHGRAELLVLSDAVEEYMAPGPVKDKAVLCCRAETDHYEGFWVTDLLRGVR